MVSFEDNIMAPHAKVSEAAAASDSAQEAKKEAGTSTPSA